MWTYGVTSLPVTLPPPAQSAVGRRAAARRRYSIFKKFKRLSEISELELLVCNRRTSTARVHPNRKLPGHRRRLRSRLVG